MRMDLSIPECSPLATCECGARIYGDSVNDTLIAWGEHVITVHKDWNNSDITGGPYAAHHA